MTSPVHLFEIWSQNAVPAPHPARLGRKASTYPVHNPGPTLEPFPGAVKLLIIFGSSIVLWALIIWSVLQLSH